MLSKKKISLNEVVEGGTAKIVAVTDDEKSFLDHLNAKGLQIGDFVVLKKREAYDGSILLINKKKLERTLSHQVAERILVEY